MYSLQRPSSPIRGLNRVLTFEGVSSAAPGARHCPSDGSLAPRDRLAQVAFPTFYPLCTQAGGHVAAKIFKSVMRWRAMECSEHIDLEETLFSGQVFHFKQAGEGRYMGVLDDTLVLLRQGADGAVLYLDSHPMSKSIVECFFNAHVDTELQGRRHGLRFLTNGFHSTLFSFICSSNNNIKRITKMVEHLYSYGRRVDAPCAEGLQPGARDGTPAGHAFYTFPELSALTGIEDDLRRNKFGYRAKYICDAARFLSQNKVEWHTLGYEEARKTLMKINGIGRKVADCICLISLRHFHVVPIDTHILRYSSRLFSLEFKALNAKTYDMIQKMWIERFGRHAGIMQLYAFKEYVDRGVRRPGR